jgi:DNA-directed RNA polymerase subunit K/omega
MSALKATKKDPKRYEESSDEEEEELENQPDEEVDDEDEDEDDDDDAGEIRDDETDDGADDYEAGGVTLETDHDAPEPTDHELLSMLDNVEDDESMLVSNDTLNIHTSPYLTKYEMTKVLALRSQQILTGAPPTVPASEFPDKRYPVDPYTIALMELKMSRLPLIIGRRLPNNTIIRIPVQSLLIPE